ncbi:MAG: hypothetical protein IK099_15110 [Clostridia bacterium]|nr:hypothetical protein [Clostridia bacterium]
MDTAHWALLGCTAALSASLALFSLTAVSQSRSYKWVRRIFWSAAALILGGMLGGAGLNLFNLAAVAGLGLPGYLAVNVLKLL